MELTPLTEEHFEMLISWAETPIVLTQWTGTIFLFPLDKKQLQEYLKPTKGDNPKRLVYVLKEGGSQKGLIELNNINQQNGTATICRVYIDKYTRNQGLGTKMIQKILSIGFEEIKLRRIDLQVFSSNTSAIKCYEKVGFKREGLLRKHLNAHNEFWDLIWYGMLKEEFEKIKENRKSTTLNTGL